VESHFQYSYLTKFDWLNSFILKEIWKPGRHIKNYLILSVPQTHIIENKDFNKEHIKLSDNITLSKDGIFFTQKYFNLPQNNRYIFFEFEYVKYIVLSKNNKIFTWFSIPKPILKKIIGRNNGKKK
jgi:hypothetical protein